MKSLRGINELLEEIALLQPDDKDICRKFGVLPGAVDWLAALRYVDTRLATTSGRWLSYCAPILQCRSDLKCRRWLGSCWL
jgi:hypothetical protein